MSSALERFPRWVALFGAVVLMLRCSNADNVQFDVLGLLGHSCRDACKTLKADCNMSAYLEIEGEQLKQIFERSEVKCVYDPREWWSFYQPAVVIEPFNENFGRCLGWHGKPEYHDCSAKHPHVRRMCRCVKDIRCPQIPRPTQPLPAES